MNSYTTKKALGSLTILSALILAPSAFADTHATTTGQVSIGRNGHVIVKNAEVTSVSGNVVNALARFANTITSWVFTTNASTTIGANNSMSAATSDIHVGDRINVAGTLASLSATASVNASRILDKTSMAMWRSKSGTVQSVDLANGTFVLKTEEKVFTVKTSVTTVFTAKPTATSTVATNLAGLAVGRKAEVTGTINADGTVLSASKVLVKPLIAVNEKKNNGKHKGFFKLGLALGHNK
jgi:hypothetical protein